MKTKDFEGYTRLRARHPSRSRGGKDGPSIATALLGVVCVVAVFGMLTLLYHFG